MKQPNPDLAAGLQRLAAWNTPEQRRQSFRALHDIHRRGLSFRAPSVLHLAKAEKPVLAKVAGLHRLLGAPEFPALLPDF